MISQCRQQTAVRRQNTLTLISEIVEESDFNEATFNSAYVSDVQSLSQKKCFASIFRLKPIDTI